MKRGTGYLITYHIKVVVSCVHCNIVLLGSSEDYLENYDFSSKLVKIEEFDTWIVKLMGMIL